MGAAYILLYDFDNNYTFAQVKKHIWLYKTVFMCICQYPYHYGMLTITSRQVYYSIWLAMLYTFYHSIVVL